MLHTRQHAPTAQTRVAKTTKKTAHPMASASSPSLVVKAFASIVILWYGGGEVGGGGVGGGEGGGGDGAITGCVTTMGSDAEVIVRPSEDERSAIDCELAVRKSSRML